jgi:hypothetical protein
MRTLLSLVCIVGLSSVSVAQSNRTAWSNLNGLKAGQEIQIVEASSKKDSGVFVSVSDSAVSFTDALGERSVLKQDVRIIKLRKPNHRLRNTLIGTGVGAGAGAGICAGAWNTTGWGRNGEAAAIGAGLGGVIGTVIGAVIPTHGSITVYTASPQ